MADRGKWEGARRQCVEPSRVDLRGHDREASANRRGPCVRSAQDSRGRRIQHEWGSNLKIMEEHVLCEYIATITYEASALMVSVRRVRAG